MYKKLAILPMMAFVTISCGGSSEYMQGLEKALTDDMRTGDSPLEEDEAKCISEKSLELVGEDTLKEKNITAENVVDKASELFLDLDQDEYLNATLSCIDLDFE